MTFFLHKASGLSPSGQPWSWGLITSGSVGEAAAETTFAGAVATMYGTGAYAAYLSSLFELTQTSTSTASSLFKQTTITRTAHAVFGANTTAGVMSDSAAMVITLRTGTATKSSHGRVFMPGWTGDALHIASAGTWLAAAVTEQATVFGTLKASLNTGGLTPVLLTRKATLGGIPALSTQAITHGDVSNKIANQRRRGDKITPARTTSF